MPSRGIGAVQHPLANLGNVGDGRGLAVLDIFHGRLLGDLDAERRIPRDDRGELHRALDLLARRHHLLHQADLAVRAMP